MIIIKKIFDLDLESLMISSRNSSIDLDKVKNDFIRNNIEIVKMMEKQKNKIYVRINYQIYEIINTNGETKGICNKSYLSCIIDFLFGIDTEYVIKKRDLYEIEFCGV